MFTYIATNTLNGRFYIGSTRNFEKRKKEHLDSRKKYPFQNALRKNPDSFEWEVWEDDSEEPILEQALLDMWFGKKLCYNINPVANHPPNNPQARKRGGSTQGVRNSSERTGIFSPGWLGSEEHKNHQAKAGKLGGERITSLGVGIQSEVYKNSPARKERDSSGAKKLNAQAWKSTHDGFVANAGNVARHNRANGWDPNDRVKVQ